MELWGGEKQRQTADSGADPSQKTKAKNKIRKRLLAVQAWIAAILGFACAMFSMGILELGGGRFSYLWLFGLVGCSIWCVWICFRYCSLTMSRKQEMKKPENRKKTSLMLLVQFILSLVIIFGSFWIPSDAFGMDADASEALFIVVFLFGISWMIAVLLVLVVCAIVWKKESQREKQRKYDNSGWQDFKPGNAPKSSSSGQSEQVELKEKKEQVEQNEHTNSDNQTEQKIYTLQNEDAAVRTPEEIARIREQASKDLTQIFSCPGHKSADWCREFLMNPEYKCILHDKYFLNTLVCYVQGPTVTRDVYVLLQNYYQAGKTKQKDLPPELRLLYKVLKKKTRRLLLPQFFIALALSFVGVGFDAENYIPALGPERTQNLMDILFVIGFYWMIGILVAGAVRGIYRRLRLRRR